MRALLLGLLSLSGMASAQPTLAKADKPEATGPTGSVSGTVVDAVTGAPVRKAQVSMTGAGREVAVTDAFGGFTINGVGAGSLMVWAHHPDYPPSSSWFPTNIQFKLTAGERKSGIEIRLRPAASLNGRVADADGDPIAGCFMTLLSGPGRLPVAGNTVTDKNGEYIFDRIAAGKYYVQAKCNSPYLQPRPFAPPDAVLPGPLLGFSPRYYPNATDLATAQNINALAGQSLRGIDFRFSPETVSTLLVRIAGASPVGVRVSLSIPLSVSTGGSAHREERYVASRSPMGAILFPGVVPGNYLMRVSTVMSEQILLASQMVEVTDQPKTVIVNAISPVPLSGIIVASPEKEDVVKNKGRRPEQHRLWLFDAEDPSISAGADIKPDGSFELRAITPGHYRVSIPNGPWVQSVSIDGVVSDGPEVEIRAGATGPLEIHTGNGGGTVSGDLQGLTQTTTQVRVILSTMGPANMRWRYDRGMFPAQPPHFSFTEPPGHYRLYIAELEPGEESAAVLDNETLSQRGEEIDIRAGKETIRNIKVITAAEIRKENQ